MQALGQVGEPQPALAPRVVEVDAGRRPAVGGEPADHGDPSRTAAAPTTSVRASGAGGSSCHAGLAVRAAGEQQGAQQRGHGVAQHRASVLSVRETTDPARARGAVPQQGAHGRGARAAAAGAARRCATSPCCTPARCPTSRPPPDWDFRVFGAVERPRPLELRRVPGAPHAQRVTTDIHCVTTWSKLGTAWEGVPGLAAPRGAGGAAPRRPTPSPTPRRTTPRTSRSSGSAPTTSSWRTASTGPGARAGPRRAAAAAGAQPLLLEERQVAARASSSSRSDRPGLLGAARLLEQRRPVEGGALRLLRGPGTTSTRSSAITAARGARPPPSACRPGSSCSPPLPATGHGGRRLPRPRHRPSRSPRWSVAERLRAREPRAGGAAARRPAPQGDEPAGRGRPHAGRPSRCWSTSILVIRAA